MQVHLNKLLAIWKTGENATKKRLTCSKTKNHPKPHGFPSFKWVKVWNLWIFSGFCNWTVPGTSWSATSTNGAFKPWLKTIGASKPRRASANPGSRLSGVVFFNEKKTNEFGLDTWFGGPLWDNPYGVLFGGSPWFCTSHGLISLMVFVVTKGPTSWPLFASIAVKFAPEQIHRSKRCQLPKLRQQDLSETKMWGNKNTYPIPLYCLVKKDSQIGGYLNPF